MNAHVMLFFRACHVLPVLVVLFLDLFEFRLLIAWMDLLGQVTQVLHR